MSDNVKLDDEVKALRQRIAELEAAEEERLRKQHALGAEGHFAQLLISSSFDGILAFDRDCHYTVWNAGMERLSGVTANQALGRCAFDVFPFLKEIGEDQFFYEALEGKTSIARNRPYTIPDTGRQGFFEGNY